MQHVQWVTEVWNKYHHHKYFINTNTNDKGNDNDKDNNNDNDNNNGNDNNNDNQESDSNKDNDNDSDNADIMNDNELFSVTLSKC